MRASMMVSIVTLFMLLLVTGCTMDSLEEVHLYEMKSFAEMKVDSLRVITDSEEIAMWHKAIKDSVKQLGIVNMADPEYRVELGEKAYFLWIGEEGGTIMDMKETHTIYSLTQKYAIAVHKAIESHYNS